MMKYVLIAAALGMANLGATAAAKAGEQRRDVAVGFADLDLSTPEGVAKLDKRLAKAVLKVCGTAHYLDAEQLDDLDLCRANARARASAARESIMRREASRPAIAARAAR